MNESLPDDQSIATSQLKLSRAVRFALAAIVLGFSYPSILFSTSIPKFQQIYQDMLGGKPLPPSTVFIIRHQTVFAGFSILLPILAVALIFSKKTIISLYSSSIVILVFFLMFYFEWHSLSAPLIDIIGGMQGYPR